MNDMVRSADQVSDADMAYLSNFFEGSGYHNKNIVLTGSTGMLGSYILESLVKAFESSPYKPHRILLPVRNISMNIMNNYSRHSYITYCEFDELKLFTGNQIILHFASPSNFSKYTNYHELVQANLEIFTGLNYESVEKFIYISSGEVSSFERSVLIQDEEYLANARFYYPRAKMESEHYYETKSKEYDFDFTIIRLFHTFGPGVKEDDGRSFADFIWSASRGNIIELRSIGSQKRTFLYSADLVSALLLILRSEHHGMRKFEIGSSQELSIFQFAKMVSEIGNVKLSLNNPSNKGLVLSNSPFDSAMPDLNAIHEIGWKENFDVEYAIRSTLNWINLETQKEKK